MHLPLFTYHTIASGNAPIKTTQPERAPPQPAAAAMDAPAGGGGGGGATAGLGGGQLSGTAAQILFVESLVLLALSVVSCLWVILAILYRKYDRKGHRQYAERRRRHREIRKFLDFTVGAFVGVLAWVCVAG